MSNEMKASEFYEKYWKVSDGKGNMVSPPALTEKEKEYLDKISNNSTYKGVYFFSRRRRSIQLNMQILKNEMSKNKQP